MSHDALQPGQFGKMTHLDDTQFTVKSNLSGGATRRISDNKQAPESGFYVSTPRQAGDEREAHALQPEDSAAHMSSLRDKGRSGYQGAWNSGHGQGYNHTYLDNSNRYTHEAVAQSHAMAGEQLSYYDANKGDVVETPKDPQVLLKHATLPSRSQIYGPQND